MSRQSLASPNAREGSHWRSSRSTVRRAKLVSVKTMLLTRILSSHIQILSRWLEVYFTPTPPERWRRGLLYVLIGIRFFKRYLPTSGDIVTRWRGVRRIPPYNSHTIDDLLVYRRVTKSQELRHLGGGVAMLLISWWSIHYRGKGDWCILILANIVINLYPVFLQRYNRVRLDLLTDRLRGRRGESYPVS
ncbi:MAG: hypothetical protein ACK5RS_17120 [Acidobacteriota bacterium]